MSKKLKLSPWHDGSIKPVHIGIYEARGTHAPFYKFSFFDGERFNGRWPTKYEALVYKNFGDGADVTSWRGILK